MEEFALTLSLIYVYLDSINSENHNKVLAVTIKFIRGSDTNPHYIVAWPCSLSIKFTRLVHRLGKHT